MNPALRLVAWSAARPRIVLLAVLALTLLAAAFAGRNFAMNTNTLELIDPQVGWRQDEAAVKRAFPQNDGLIVVVVDGATPELAEDAAARLAARLGRDRQHFESVRRPDGGPFFAQNGLLFRTPEAVADTAARMVKAQPFLGPLAADPSLRGVAGAMETLAGGVTRGEATLAEVEAPLARLGEALAARREGRPAFFSWAALVAGGADGGPPTRRLVLAQPRLDFTALQPGARASAEVREAAAGLGLTPGRGVTVRLTGSAPLADDEFRSLRHNVGLVAGLMAGAMLGIVWFAVRSARVMAAIIAVTLAGLVVTAALGLAAVGAFNLISVAFIPLFVGIGIDFAIQLGLRFQAERHHGAALAQALAGAARRLGPSLVLAAGAVALGFVAFLPTAYVGVSELGVIAALGMAVAIGLTLTALPALLMLIRPPQPRRALESPGLAGLDRFLVERRRFVLSAFGIAMAASIASLPFVRFDFNPLNLRDPASESRATLTDLERDPDRTTRVAEILAPGLTQADALAGRLRALPEVRRVVTLSSFVPAAQEEKLAALGDASFILDLTLNPLDVAPPPGDAEVRTALGQAAAALRAAAAADPARGGSALRLSRELGALAQASPQARAEAAAMLVPPLRATLGALGQALSAQPVTLEGLPPDLRRDWLAPDGRARIVAYPHGDVTDNAAIARFTAAVREVAPRATGPSVTIQEAARTIADSFILAGVLALGAISALLYYALRSVREVAFTLAPVVLSGFLTLMSCVLIRQPVNFANIIAFPLLFGVGVAFHIYFVKAWGEGATGLLQSSLARAVFFSALATGTAFGSLVVSSHPGTASMGLVLAISLVWTLVCALVFEPALLGPPRALSPAPAPSR